MLQNKAFLLKNRFRSYVCGFSTQVNYYSTAHKWHRKSFTNHFARKQLLRKPPDTTILDTFAMLKRFFEKRVMTTPVLFYACFLVSLLFFCYNILPNAQAPQIIPQVVFFSFHDLHVVAFLTRFTKILESIKDFLKKQASKLLSCRGGLGEAPYNTPRHSLQRCRSKALWDRGIVKLALFEFSYLNVLKVF